ncbi:MAG: hypothetical protein GY904_10965 [Planctomycetaceae bacterium]|nr:hypothetical protein [Planctomycetaceae bacterium]
MGHTEHELESRILGDPLDDSLRVELEELLAEREPDGVDIELLRRERLIADSLVRGQSIDRAMHDYKQFRDARSDYFWDNRGCRNHLFRPFSLWLVHCEPSRQFALNVAIENKLNQTINFNSLPVEVLRGKQPNAAFDTRNAIMEFVRRYRGPSGTEPELVDSEIAIQMLATYSEINAVESPDNNTLDRSR